MVNNSVGSSCGTTEEEGTNKCSCFFSKNSTNVRRTFSPDHFSSMLSGVQNAANFPAVARGVCVKNHNLLGYCGQEGSIVCDSPAWLHALKFGTISSLSPISHSPVCLVVSELLTFAQRRKHKNKTRVRKVAPEVCVLRIVCSTQMKGVPCRLRGTLAFLFLILTSCKCLLLPAFLSSIENQPQLGILSGNHTACPSVQSGKVSGNESCV